MVRKHIVKLSRLGAMTILVALSTLTKAQDLTQTEYNLKVKQAYRQLERAQLDLNRVLDQKKHSKLIIEKSCLYVNQLKSLNQFSLDNIHLDQAQDEVQFTAKLIQNYEQSFADLGTTYQESCQKQ